MDTKWTRNELKQTEKNFDITKKQSTQEHLAQSFKEFRPLCIGIPEKFPADFKVPSSFSNVKLKAMQPRKMQKKNILGTIVLADYFLHFQAEKMEM